MAGWTRAPAPGASASRESLRQEVSARKPHRGTSRAHEPGTSHDCGRLGHRFFTGRHEKFLGYATCSTRLRARSATLLSPAVRAARSVALRWRRSTRRSSGGTLAQYLRSDAGIPAAPRAARAAAPRRRRPRVCARELRPLERAAIVGVGRGGGGGGGGARRRPRRVEQAVAAVDAPPAPSRGRTRARGRARRPRSRPAPSGTPP